ncbi:hypothetical protein [Mesonia aestuariivivens]|uniref:CHAT domain-containing protein n=1 Tax=Mesonia aestuariivivens TaxID=2796128 RepID=A0ABS6W4Z6_9FLAO|nr:hypothetical protein [Mesonia aestuariivivens]MBW2962943.1 hypothetical protein [Mesonia aestuariivivens]
MIIVIISIDPSTKFLFDIVDRLKSNSIVFELIEIHPNTDSYKSCLDNIAKLPENTTILFLGHGQDDKIYGGELLDDFPKQPLVKRNEMGIFKNQNLFLLACDSASLIKSSFRIAKTNKAIGFGPLPTEIEEVESDKKLANEGITLETIELFKQAINETVILSLLEYFKDESKDFIFLKDYLNLHLNKRINKAILEDENRNLADLLFNMKNDMVIY